MKPVDYLAYAWTAAQWLIVMVVLWAGLRLGNPDGPAWISLAGGAIMTFSLIPAVLGFRALGANLSPWVHPRAANRLVTHGIYRSLRHPLYLSLIVFSFGWSVWSQSWTSLLGSVVLAFVLKGKASCEERLLARRHPDYASYARSTTAFFPRRPRRPKSRTP
jgi:protein-S-isoprenylcysteine O-methyltransferase Ste14